VEAAAVMVVAVAELGGGLKGLGEAVVVANRLVSRRCNSPDMNVPIQQYELVYLCPSHRRGTHSRAIHCMKRCHYSWGHQHNLRVLVAVLVPVMA
jgi:hypothetical protein